MKERCSNCRGLEEDIYWTHFQSMHFCQFLPQDFHSQLMIPERFSEKMRGKLKKKLIIRGPSGTNWDVKLVETDDDLLYFGDGWGKFVDAHNLAEKDILMFTYKGNSEFDVLIFDGNSLCEKEKSYFVTKCGHTNPQAPTRVKDCSITVENTRKGKEKEKETVVVDCETSDAFDRDPHSKDTKIGLHKACSGEPKKRGQSSSEIWETVKLPGMSFSTSFELDFVKTIGMRQKPLRKVKATTNNQSSASNRRHVTESEKAAVLKSASEELSEGSLCVVMQGTNLHRNFLSLPVNWVTKNIALEKQDVILRTKERSWNTRLTFSSVGYGTLCYGWKRFVVDNRLEEFDVCVFKLAEQNRKPVVLDVSIFRVVPEVGLPSSSQGGSSMNKRKFLQLGNDAQDS